MTQNILAEYEQEPMKHSRYYIPTAILLGIFSGYLLVDTFMDLENLTWKGFNGDWMNMLLSIIIPCCGLGFFIAKKRIGWFISATFFSLIAFAAIASILYISIQRIDLWPLLTLNKRQIFITATAIILSIFLHTKSIRIYFRVKNLIWFVSIAISLSLTLLLFLLN